MVIHDILVLDSDFLVTIPTVRGGDVLGRLLSHHPPMATRVAILLVSGLQDH